MFQIPKTKGRHKVTKKDLIKNQLVKGAGCFTKNTKILTPNGYKNSNP